VAAATQRLLSLSLERQLTLVGLDAELTKKFVENQM
jgi:hypothetical protein